MRQILFRFGQAAACATVLVAGLVCTANAQLHWEALAPFMDPRTGGGGIEGGSAGIIGSTIYVAKGYRPGDTPFLSSYDIPTDTWTHISPMLPDAFVPNSEGAGAVAGGKLYTIGGRPAISVGTVVEQFTPGGVWMPKAAMPTARRGLGTGSLGGKIYAAGGSDGAVPLSGTPTPAFEVFDPTAGPLGTWAPLAPMPVPLMDTEATVALNAADSGSLAGKVYVFGGFSPFSGFSSAVQIFDIASGTWAFGAPMPTARSNSMAGVIHLGTAEDGKIAVYGGFAGGPNLPITELYDPLTDSWMAGPAMLFPQSEHAVGPLADGTGLYAIGSGIFGLSVPFVERLVPEPSTLVLLAIAGALLLIARWRKAAYVR